MFDKNTDFWIICTSKLEKCIIKVLPMVLGAHICLNTPKNLDIALLLRGHTSLHEHYNSRFRIFALFGGPLSSRGKEWTGSRCSRVQIFGLLVKITFPWPYLSKINNEKVLPKSAGKRALAPWLFANLKESLETNSVLVNFERSMVRNVAIL